MPFLMHKNVNVRQMPSQVPSQSSVNDVVGSVNQIQDILQYNNALAIDQAAQQRNWTERMWSQNAAFNQAEAEKNRQWQEYMSNTAHQREVADLKAAGLNPVLSAMGGNGAPVTSGASASASYGTGANANLDQSGASALVSLLSAFLTSQTNLQMANLSARTNEAVADKYTAMEGLVAQLGRQNVLDQIANSHDIAMQQILGNLEVVARSNENSYRIAELVRDTDLSIAALARENVLDQISGSKYVSDNSLLASKISAGAVLGAAETSAAASRYVSDNNLEGTKFASEISKEIAAMNNDAKLDQIDSQAHWDEYLKDHYPNTWAAIAQEILQNHPERSGAITAISRLGDGILNAFNAINGRGKTSALDPYLSGYQSVFD